MTTIPNDNASKINEILKIESRMSFQSPENRKYLLIVAETLVNKAKEILPDHFFDIWYCSDMKYHLRLNIVDKEGNIVEMLGMKVEDTFPANDIYTLAEFEKTCFCGNIETNAERLERIEREKSETFEEKYKRFWDMYQRIKVLSSNYLFK